MAVIDHLVHAVPDLAAGVADIAERFGVQPAPGGSHPGRGTANALLSLGDCYLEIIGPDPAQPEPADGRPFGVTATMEPGLVTFAVRPGDGETLDEVAAALLSAGHDPGPAVPMSRATPDGSELNWHLTYPTMAAGGTIPFLIDWGLTPNPATTAPSAGRLVDLEGIPAAIADALHLPPFSGRSRPLSEQNRPENGQTLAAVIRLEDATEIQL